MSARAYSSISGPRGLSLQSAIWYRLSAWKPTQVWQGVMAGTTEGAQKDAATQLNLAMDTASFDEVSKVLTRDMDNSIAAAEKTMEQRKQALYSFGGSSAAPTTAPAANRPAAGAARALTPANEDPRAKVKAALEAGVPRDKLLQRMQESGIDSSWLQ